ncbi:MAG: 50S ribosomal protein L29 [Candidatus Bathyarchaeia archaeon]
MPMKRVREIREKSSEDLLKRLSELKTELVRMRTMVEAGGAVKNQSSTRTLELNMFPMLTVINEKTREAR